MDNKRNKSKPTTSRIDQECKIPKVKTSDNVHSGQFKCCFPGCDYEGRSANALGGHKKKHNPNRQKSKQSNEKISTVKPTNRRQTDGPFFLFPADSSGCAIQTNAEEEAASIANQHNSKRSHSTRRQNRKKNSLNTANTAINNSVNESPCIEDDVFHQKQQTTPSQASVFWQNFLASSSFQNASKLTKSCIDIKNSEEGQVTFYQERQSINDIICKTSSSAQVSRVASTEKPLNGQSDSVNLLNSSSFNTSPILSKENSNNKIGNLLTLNNNKTSAIIDSAQPISLEKKNNGKVLVSISNTCLNGYSSCGVGSSIATHVAPAANNNNDGLNGKISCGIETQPVVYTTNKSSNQNSNLNTTNECGGGNEIENSKVILASTKNSNGSCGGSSVLGVNFTTDGEGNSSKNQNTDDSSNSINGFITTGNGVSGINKNQNACNNRLVGLTTGGCDGGDGGNNGNAGFTTNPGGGVENNNQVHGGFVTNGGGGNNNNQSGGGGGGFTISGGGDNNNNQNTVCGRNNVYGGFTTSGGGVVNNNLAGGDGGGKNGNIGFATSGDGGINNNQHAGEGNNAQAVFITSRGHYPKKSQNLNCGGGNNGIHGFSEGGRDAILHNQSNKSSIKNCFNAITSSAVTNNSYIGLDDSSLGSQLAKATKKTNIFSFSDGGVVGINNNQYTAGFSTSRGGVLNNNLAGGCSGSGGNNGNEGNNDNGGIKTNGGGGNNNNQSGGGGGSNNSGFTSSGGCGMNNSVQKSNRGVSKLHFDSAIPLASKNQVTNTSNGSDGANSALHVAVQNNNNRNPDATKQIFDNSHIRSKNGSTTGKHSSDLGPSGPPFALGPHSESSTIYQLEKSLDNCHQKQDFVVSGLKNVFSRISAQNQHLSESNSSLKMQISDCQNGNSSVLNNLISRLELVEREYNEQLSHVYREKEAIISSNQLLLADNIKLRQTLNENISCNEHYTELFEVAKAKHNFIQQSQSRLESELLDLIDFNNSSNRNSHTDHLFGDLKDLTLEDCTKLRIMDELEMEAKDPSHPRYPQCIICHKDYSQYGSEIKIREALYRHLNTKHFKQLHSFKNMYPDDFYSIIRTRC